MPSRTIIFNLKLAGELAAFSSFWSFSRRPDWVNGVPYFTWEREHMAKPIRNKPLIWWATLFSCWVPTWEITPLLFSHCLSNHSNHPPTRRGHHLIALTLTRLKQIFEGQEGGCGTAPLENTSQPHWFIVCFLSDAFLKGCTFFRTGVWACQRISKQLLELGFITWAIPKSHTPVKDVCLLFFPSGILLAPIFMEVLGFSVSAICAKWWLLSSLSKGRYKCCSGLRASPTTQL